MDHEAILAALRGNRYEARYFQTKEEAAAYLNETLDGAEIGFGDSATIAAMGLAKSLAAHNTVTDPSQYPDIRDFVAVGKKCLTTEYFLTSVNAITESGILVNMDGTGNRVAGSLFGHKKVFFVVGRNKICPTLEDAVYRVRNVAAPRNAQRFGKKTPCAVKGDKCYDCKSPERICNGLVIHYKKMSNMEMEVILIDEDLGL